MKQVAERAQVEGVAVVARPSCYLCGQPGTHLYKHLVDRLYSVPGSWNIRRCSDSRCGLLWLDPVPLDCSEFYDTYYTHQDAAKHSAEETTFSARLRWFVRFGAFRGSKTQTAGKRAVRACLGALTGFVFPPLLDQALTAKTGRLLDVGCGDGDLVLAAQERGWQAEGVDSDSMAANFARRRGANVQAGSVAGQRYEGGTFDSIVMSHVIEHVSDPIDTLRECYRILKPGGRLVLATPDIESQFHQEFAQDWVHLDPPRHVHLFGPGTLSEVVRRAGFSKQRAFTALGAPFVYQASEQIRRTGKYRERTSGVTMNVRAAAKLAAELMTIKFGRGLGEELRLIAEK